MTANTQQPARKRRIRHRRCKHCGVIGTPYAPISSRGKCGPCGERRAAECIRDQHDRSGPFYELWAIRSLEAAIAATGGRVLPYFEGGLAQTPSGSGLDNRMIG
jgi:hypothetical protein